MLLGHGGGTQFHHLIGHQDFVDVHLLFLSHCTGALKHTIAPPYRCATGVRHVVGRERTNIVPQPRRERTSRRPCKPSMLFLTTSRPTPRPEMSVTWSAVEKPGAKINCQMSDSDRSWAELMSPCAKALWTIFPLS